MNGGGSLRQSIGALDGNLGRDVRLDGSVGLRGCEVGDETVQTEAHRGPRKTRFDSRACIGAGAALPSGGTVEEDALRDAGSVVTKYDPSTRDPR
jgi:acetyltransferase-like isoleucine patch superfamily enzyme